jgi:hypothetical protein
MHEEDSGALTCPQSATSPKVDVFMPRHFLKLQKIDPEFRTLPFLFFIKKANRASHDRRSSPHSDVLP